MNHVELAKKMHKRGVKEALQLIGESMIRLQEKLKHEKEIEKEIETITDEEYLLKYPDKVEKVKQMFGEN